MYFQADQQAIAVQEAAVEAAQARLTEIEEEQGAEDGLFADLEKINASEINKLLKQLKPTKKVKEYNSADYAMVAEPAVVYEIKNSFEILEEYLELEINIKKANARIKELNSQLEQKVLAQYPNLTESEIKTLVINHKWQAHLHDALQSEQEKLSQNLTQRIKALAERYANTLPQLEAEVQEVSAKVTAHLQKMGWSW